MSPERFADYMQRIEALVARAPEARSLDLTARDKTVLENMPESIREALESQLAAYTPQSVDIRTQLAYKGVATLLQSVPMLAAAVEIGYEMGGEA